MIGLRILFYLGVLVVCVSCATTKTFSPEDAPEYVVTRDFSPFFRLGPMQAGGPDASLTADIRVKLLSQEMGYSRVQLEDGRTGYVANENLAVAPPRPPPESDDHDSDRRSHGRKHHSPGVRYQGEEVNDIPLPDPALQPDLNIAPEVIPSPTPTPDAPLEKPKFRF